MPDIDAKKIEELRGLLGRCHNDMCGTVATLNAAGKSSMPLPPAECRRLADTLWGEVQLQRARIDAALEEKDA